MSKSRKISEAQAIHIRDLLVRELDARYGPKDADGFRRVGQRKICEEVGLKQPVLQDIENATGGIGVHALVAIRNFLKTHTIDDLLMLDPLPAKQPARESVAPSLDAIRTVVFEGVAEALAAGTKSEPPTPKTSPPPMPKGKSDAPRPRRR